MDDNQYSYYKNKKHKKPIKGCNYKCPCPGRWINCEIYDWWKRNKNYWLDRWRNEQRYKAAHEKLDGSMDFHVSSIANG